MRETVLPVPRTVSWLATLITARPTRSAGAIQARVRPTTGASGSLVECADPWFVEEAAFARARRRPRAHMGIDARERIRCKALAARPAARDRNSGQVARRARPQRALPCAEPDRQTPASRTIPTLNPIASCKGDRAGTSPPLQSRWRRDALSCGPGEQLACELVRRSMRQRDAPNRGCRHATPRGTPRGTR